MFIYKKKYFLIIENTKDLDLSKIKLSNKFIIIYRNIRKIKKIEEIIKFRKQCRTKRIEFFVSNNLTLMNLTKADGIYISAYNLNLSYSNLKRTRFKIIGSAHNIKELNIKIIQGCNNIIYSRLFKTNYIDKPGFLGIVKFNLLSLSRKENLVPLGGINSENLNKMSMVNSNSLTLMSEVKKKPAKIFSRLF